MGSYYRRPRTTASRYFCDQTLKREQNLAGRRLAVVALSAIQLPIIRNNLPAIVAAIDRAVPGSFQIVDCGTFSRRKPTGE